MVRFERWRLLALDVLGEFAGAEDATNSAVVHESVQLSSDLLRCQMLHRREAEDATGRPRVDFGGSAGALLPLAALRVLHVVAYRLLVAIKVARDPSVALFLGLERDDLADLLLRELLPRSHRGSISK